MDPRIERTQRSLQAALLQLAAECPLDEIAIGDITALAGVHRSTFSQHYPDKETLLAEALDAVVDSGPELPTAADEPDDAALLATVEEFLSHVAEHAAVYRKVLGPNGSPLAADRVRQRVELIVRTGIEGHPDLDIDDLPLEILASGVAGSAIGIVRAWLDDDEPAPVSTAARWVWLMLVGPLSPLSRWPSGDVDDRG